MLLILDYIWGFFNIVTTINIIYNYKWNNSKVYCEACDIVLIKKTRLLLIKQRMNIRGYNWLSERMQNFFDSKIRLTQWLTARTVILSYQNLITMQVLLRYMLLRQKLMVNHCHNVHSETYTRHIHGCQKFERKILKSTFTKIIKYQ